VKWTVQRRDSGVALQSEGHEGWEKVLRHEDVTEPGRLHYLLIEEIASPVCILLKEDEQLFFARRRVRKAIPGNNGHIARSDAADRTVVGVQKPDGTGFYAFIHADGRVLLKTDLEEY